MPVIYSDVSRTENLMGHNKSAAYNFSMKLHTNLLPQWIQTQTHFFSEITNARIHKGNVLQEWRQGHEEHHQQRNFISHHWNIIHLFHLLNV